MMMMTSEERGGVQLIVVSCCTDTVVSGVQLYQPALNFGGFNICKMKFLLLLLLCGSSSVFAQESTAEASTTTDLRTSSEKGTTHLLETTATEGATSTTARTSLGDDTSPPTVADITTETPSIATDVDNTTTISSRSTDDANTTHSSDASTHSSTHLSTPEPVTTPVPPKPAQPPYVDDEFHVLNHTNNVTCLKVKIAIQFEVKYFQTNKDTAIAYINVPTNANVTDASSCGEDTDVLSLEWDNYNLTLTFSNNRTKKYGLSEIQFAYMVNMQDFPGAEEENVTKEVSKTIPFDSKLAGNMGKSYKCDAAEKLQLNDNVTMNWEHAQVQAFMTADSFSTAEDCAPDDKTDDIVPIAVGCALAGLVIIVLIAYMVGRRRSRQKGYQSV